MTDIKDMLRYLMKTVWIVNDEIHGTHSWTEVNKRVWAIRELRGANCEVVNCDRNV